MLPIKIQLPEEFFREEVRSGYTVSEEMKKVWAVELDLLVEFDRICREIGVRYFLDGGTLLGAIRHKGFIPWDDDIDVLLLRKDYDRLTEKAGPLFRHPYFLQNAYTDRNYYRGHSQIRNSLTTALLSTDKGKPFNQGVFIDVFVVDGINEKTLEQQLKKRKQLIRYCKWLSSPQSTSPVKTLLKKAGIKSIQARYGDVPGIFSRIEDLFRGNDDSEYVDKIMWSGKIEREYWIRREWFDRTEYLPFEGIQCPVPCGYKEIMAAYYGEDYMTPRHAASTHEQYGGIVFDTAVPYTRYLAEHAESRKNV